MAKILFTNNASSKLAGALTAIATSLSVTSAEGGKFPNPSGGDWFMATLVKLVSGVATYEIVKVTARAGDVLTIVRGQEGTTATTFSAGDAIELRMTAGSADEFARIGSANTYTAKQTLSGAAIDEAKGANVASAATIDLTNTTGNLVHVTGTTGITAITIPSGAERDIVFDGILTLTNGANLDLPGAANITTAAGDRMRVRGDGSVARAMSFTKANGQALVGTAASIGNHEVVVHTGTTNGSTNTAINRYTTTLTNVGTAITYADSATLGASFTINETGIYSIYMQDRSSSDRFMGVSLNSAQLTTAINAINVANRVILAHVELDINYIRVVSRVVRLQAGDVIRPHGEPSNTVFGGDSAVFAIRKVGI